MKKFSAVLCLFAILLPALAWGASDADVRTAVGNSIAKSEDAGSISKIVDVYGGKGVLSSKDALWWVKDGKAYTVNGIAAQLSPNAPKAPPSVTAGKVHSAAEGTALPLPPHFALTGEELAAKVEAVLKQAAEEEKAFKSAVLKKDTYFEYTLYAGKETAAQFSFKECGGMVTAVAMSGYAVDKESDKRTPLTSVLTIALLRAVVPDKEARAPFMEIMGKSKKGGTKTSGNVTMIFKRSKDMMEMSLTPVDEAQNGKAASQKAEPFFKMTPQKFVENFNKAAKAAKVDQRAALGPANEKSVQVKASKNNGALLTINDAGNITSVMHIGTGDGTPESGANIMLGMTFAIAGVKPQWNAKQCYEVLKKLGFGSSNTLPEKSSATVDGVLFEFRASQEAGIWLIITPKP